MLDKKRFKYCKVGDIKFLGKYKGKRLEWVVTRCYDNGVELFTRYAVGASVALDSGKEWTDYNRENHFIKWLNNTFYNNVFSEEEKKLLSVQWRMYLSTENVSDGDCAVVEQELMVTAPSGLDCEMLPKDIKITGVCKNSLPMPYWVMGFGEGFKPQLISAEGLLETGEFDDIVGIRGKILIKF